MYGNIGGDGETEISNINSITATTDNFTNLHFGSVDLLVCPYGMTSWSGVSASPQYAGSKLFF